jgi:hypothetical protein
MMNAHDIAWLGASTFVVGIVFGVVGQSALRNVLHEAERARHEDMMIEQGKEIARLRTQVALHIGKEK